MGVTCPISRPKAAKLFIVEVPAVAKPSKRMVKGPRNGYFETHFNPSMGGAHGNCYYIMPNGRPKPFVRAHRGAGAVGSASGTLLFIDELLQLQKA